MNPINQTTLHPYSRSVSIIGVGCTPFMYTMDNPETNGFTEGCNNKIKVLKRNAYGYRNFERFRKHILNMFRYKSEKAKSELYIDWKNGDITHEAYCLDFPLVHPAYIVPNEAFDKCFYKSENRFLDIIKRLFPLKLKSQIKKLIH